MITTRNVVGKCISADKLIFVSRPRTLETERKETRLLVLDPVT